MRILKLCILGIVIGILELILIVIISNVWAVAIFEDVAFGFGIGTLILGLFALIGTKRVHTGMNISPDNSVAQSSFQADIAFQETKLLKSVPRLPAGLMRTIPIFIAAAVVFIGFGISIIIF